jgi:hypothetical protein
MLSTNLFENFHENSLKRDLSNATTVNPPLFSLVITVIKKKIKFSSYIGKFRVEQLQSHI